MTSIFKNPSLRFAVRNVSVRPFITPIEIEIGKKVEAEKIDAFLTERWKLISWAGIQFQGQMEACRKLIPSFFYRKKVAIFNLLVMC